MIGLSLLGYSFAVLAMSTVKYSISGSIFHDLGLPMSTSVRKNKYISEGKIVEGHENQG